MTTLLLLLSLSFGSGQAILHFDTPEACEAMRQRLLTLSTQAQSYIPFEFHVTGYCVPEGT